MRLLAVVGMCLLAGSVLAEVTEEDLAEQAAKVAAEQAKLDSLTSLSAAQTWQAVVDSDEVLTLYGLEAQVASRPAGGGDRDPMYIDTVVPYFTWTPFQQRVWNWTLSTSGPLVIKVSADRYTIHRGNMAAFVALFKTFVAEQLEGAE